MPFSLRTLLIAVLTSAVLYCGAFYWPAVDGSPPTTFESLYRLAEWLLFLGFCFWFTRRLLRIQRRRIQAALEEYRRRCSDLK